MRETTNMVLSFAVKHGHVNKIAKVYPGHFCFVFSSKVFIFLMCVSKAYRKNKAYKICKCIHIFGSKKQTEKEQEKIKENNIWGQQIIKIHSRFQM